MLPYEFCEISRNTFLYNAFFLNFCLEEETMRNIYNQNVTELAHYMIVFYTQELVPALAIRNFSLTLIFFSFAIFFWSYTSPLNFESSWQPSTSSCGSIKWPAKDTLISLQPLAIEKKMNLESSSKWTDSLLSMNHWYSYKSSLFKTFWIF